MYSEALLQMDRNTVNLMIEDMKKELVENSIALAEKDNIIAQNNTALAEKDNIISEKDARIAELEALIKQNK